MQRRLRFPLLGSKAQTRVRVRCKRLGFIYKHVNIKPKQTIRYFFSISQIKHPNQINLSTFLFQISDYFRHLNRSIFG
ncbi:hypothetical protein L6452_00993 [Arctium lappa]|uniref:Uncharacterized protein n=1 Tax=Arctium lappa TaxID=4217 RepID=A0ACB9FFJ4_ARCLA|nr:hypothetical protein L6452_00993 [Arctium lappa]